MIPIFAYVLLIVSVLTIASLGGFIAEKSGVINFAIEGYMIIGALAYVFISQRVAEMPGGESLFNQIWIVIVAGGFAALSSLVHAYASIRFRADQVISSIAFNLLALGLAVFLINSSENISGSSDAKAGYDIPLSIGENTSQPEYVLTLAIFFAIVLGALIIFGYRKTKLGYRIRAVGSNPIAAASVGIKVNRVRTIAVCLSGFVGGIAGALYSGFNVYFSGSVSGLGFLAVAIWIFGQWKPLWIILAAAIFGFSFGIADRISGLPGAENFAWNPPKGFLKLIPFIVSIITLIVISFISKRQSAPKYIGVPYVKGQTN